MIPIFVQLQWQLHKQWFFFGAGAVALYSVDNLFFRRCWSAVYRMGLVREGPIFNINGDFNGYEQKFTK